MEHEVLLLWASLAISILYYLLSIRSGTRGRLPGPRPLPLIGNLLDLRGNNNNLHHILARLARSHGPVMYLKMALTTVVVISSRDMAREAFTKHDKRLAARAIPDAAHALGWSKMSMIWLPSSDPQWKTMRNIVASHIFSPGSLAAVRSVRERKVRDLLCYFRECAGKEVDLGQAVYGGLLNLVSNAFFSVDVVKLGDETSVHGLHELIGGISDMVSEPNVSDLFPFLQLLDLQGRRHKTVGQLQKVFSIFDGIIDHRLAEACSSKKNKHNDFLDVLLDLMSTGKIARDMVRIFMFDVFVAGTDTIASTVEWAMVELLHNPGVMAKSRQEIKVAFGEKESIQEPEAASLPYLQAVVKEAMRLHPVVPLLLPHKATEDGVEIGGYVVPKGCTVIFNSWAIMRDTTSWERPEEFVPERFMGRVPEVNFRGSKEFDFLPFGSGRRQCPGLPMAERVVSHVLASLLHAFEWRLPDGVSAEQLDMRERFATVNHLAVPLKAVPFMAF